VSRDGAREHGFEGLGRAERGEHGRPHLAGQRGSNHQTETVLHDDGQGTISTASRAGSPATPLHYAPFGRRVNTQGAPIASSPATGVTRGYTGHEHDDAQGLVNMKGRMYDPSLGVFLTPDPVIEQAFSGRTYGAYGYVLNNPSTFIDPTGFETDCTEGPCLRFLLLADDLESIRRIRAAGREPDPRRSGVQG
jgi:RHS repeat-associated protein